MTPLRRGPSGALGAIIARRCGGRRGGHRRVFDITRVIRFCSQDARGRLGRVRAISSLGCDEDYFITMTSSLLRRLLLHYNDTFITEKARVRTLRGDAGFEGGDEGGDHPAHAGVEKQLQHRGQPV
eukprot:1178200-Prorocentrum_minimum.AAC.8